jgi:hypothetical protein
MADVRLGALKEVIKHGLEVHDSAMDHVIEAASLD